MAGERRPAATPSSVVDFVGFHSSGIRVGITRSGRMMVASVPTMVLSRKTGTCSETA